MIWRIEFSESAKKELGKLDRQVQKEIRDYLRKRIGTEEDPRRFGEALLRNLSGLWKYRVGSYRVICRIEENRVTVLVLRVGHRREVYQ